MTREQWLIRCGVGERYWLASRDRLRDSGPVIDYLDNLAENVARGDGLVLLGTIGVGKTAALSLIASEAQGAGVAAAWYVTVTRLISHLLRTTEMRTEWVSQGKDGYGGSICREEQIDPKTWPLLLLDELGAAYESDYAMAAFEDYIGWRYDHELATCVAGNLTPEQVRENPHYGRMVDRWRETCRVIVIGGESQRNAIAAQMRREAQG